MNESNPQNSLLNLRYNLFTKLLAYISAMGAIGLTLYIGYIFYYKPYYPLYSKAPHSFNYSFGIIFLILGYLTYLIIPIILLIIRTILFETFNWYLKRNSAKYYVCEKCFSRPVISELPWIVRWSGRQIAVEEPKIHDNLLDYFVCPRDYDGTHKLIKQKILKIVGVIGKDNLRGEIFGNELWVNIFNKNIFYPFNSININKIAIFIGENIDYDKSLEKIDYRLAKRNKINVLIYVDKNNKKIPVFNKKSHRILKNYSSIQYLNIDESPFKKVNANKNQSSNPQNLNKFLLTTKIMIYLILFILLSAIFLFFFNHKEKLSTTNTTSTNKIEFQKNKIDFHQAIQGKRLKNTNNKVMLKNAQTVLKQKGYYHGKIDGLWGSLSQSAFRQFQIDNNLLTTELPDRETMEILGVQYASYLTPSEIVSFLYNISKNRYPNQLNYYKYCNPLLNLQTEYYDLDIDAVEEVFVYQSNKTGINNLYIFQKKDFQYHVISKFVGNRISVLEYKTNNYHDILVFPEQTSKELTQSVIHYQWNGNTYIQKANLIDIKK